MIVATDAVFPNNIVALICNRFVMEDSDFFVSRRPLRATDPSQSLGVYASQWTPNEDSYEIKNKFLGSGPSIGPNEPTLQDYIITIQAFVKDMDPERGLATHSVFSKIVRTMLYRDEPLRIGLASLSFSMDGSTERLLRWKVRNQRYHSNELQSNWLYLSTLELFAETETI